MAELSYVLFELPWYVLFVFAVLHAVKIWGNAKTAVFFIPAVLWGILLEYANQEVFKSYHYGSGFLFYVLGEPLALGFAWAALIYFGYVFAARHWKIKEYWKVPVAASFPLLAFDFLVLEPLAKTFGYWVWTKPGFWFDAPLSNFYGWFWVVVLYLTVFQSITSKKWGWKEALAVNLLAIPPLVGVLILLLKVYKAVAGSL